MTSTLRLALALALGMFTLVSAQQAPDRTKIPEPGPVKPLQLPAIQKRQLSNGVPVWIVERHEVPIAQVTLLVFSGTADDPAGKYGVASLTSTMLQDGAGSRSALEIADAVDFLGANLGSGSGVDSSAVRLYVPVARLGDALPIMADVALRPTFPKDELDRRRQQRLTSILQARDNPETIVSIAFTRELYGPEHRYGTPSFGTAETVKAFTLEDLKAFHAAVFRPDNAALVVVGDVTADRVVPMLEAQFGSWKATAGPVPHQKLSAAQQPPRRQVFLVDKPGSSQSQIRIGWIGVPRSTPDYFPLEVMNTILGGGGLSARLNQNLREKHGYAYGAGSGFDMRIGAGPFSAGAGVQIDKTAEALKEFFVELSSIHQPVPADELTRDKNYIALHFPAGFETSGGISRRLEEQITYRLPDNYFSSYIQNIEAVTAADVRRVAEKYVDPSRAIVVVVGDLKTIEAPIRALNLGPVKVLTLDDVFGPAPSM